MMNIKEDAVFGVVGVCGINGNLIARILSDNGYKVIANDMLKEEECLFNSALKNYPDIEVIHGKIPDEFYEKIDYIILPIALIKSKSEQYRKAKEKNITFVTVEDILSLFEPAHPVICITGTNGKTTTTNLLKYIARYGGKHPSEHNLEGMQGNAGDIPALQSRLKGDLNVLETGTFGISGSLKKLAGPCKPDVGLITNITPDHLDENADFLSYAKVKGELIKLLQGKEIIVNNDDPTIKGLIRELNYKGKVITFGIEHNIRRHDKKQCVCGKQIEMDEIIAGVGRYECSCGIKYEKPDYLATNINDQHNKFTLVTPENEKYEFSLKINGVHNIYNALGSIIVAHNELKMEYPTIIKAVSEFEGVAGRMEKLTVIGNKQIMVDYAHNPAGITTVLKELKILYDTIVNVITVSSESGIEADKEILERSLEYADYVVPASHNAFICAKKVLETGKYGDKIILPDYMPEGDKEGTLGATEEQVLVGLNKALTIDADLLVCTGEAAFKFKYDILNHLEI
ncbi:MAG: UDP-N-acetylmuramate--alanine ligase [Methanosphaera sp.]|nr:UDP-N-acetylmuramate--alanine ligase [Methanosphaera sp.]